MGSEVDLVPDGGCEYVGLGSGNASTQEVASPLMVRNRQSPSRRSEESNRVLRWCCGSVILRGVELQRRKQMKYTSIVMASFFFSLFFLFLGVGWWRCMPWANN